MCFRDFSYVFGVPRDSIESNNFRFTNVWMFTGYWKHKIDILKGSIFELLTPPGPLCNGLIFTEGSRHLRFDAIVYDEQIFLYINCSQFIYFHKSSNSSRHFLIIFRTTICVLVDFNIDFNNEPRNINEAASR